MNSEQVVPQVVALLNFYQRKCEACWDSEQTQSKGLW